MGVALKTLRGSIVLFAGGVWLPTDRECPTYVRGTLPARGDAAPCVVVVATDQIEGGQDAVLHAMNPQRVNPVEPVSCTGTPEQTSEDSTSPVAIGVKQAEEAIETHIRERRRRRASDDDMGVF